MILRAKKASYTSLRHTFPDCFHERTASNLWYESVEVCLNTYLCAYIYVNMHTHVCILACVYIYTSVCPSCFVTRSTLRTVLYERTRCLLCSLYSPIAPRSSSSCPRAPEDVRQQSETERIDGLSRYTGPTKPMEPTERRAALSPELLGTGPEAA